MTVIAEASPTRSTRHTRVGVLLTLAGAALAPVVVWLVARAAGADLTVR